jgi:hypothetical protein
MGNDFGVIGLCTFISISLITELRVLEMYLT